MSDLKDTAVREFIKNKHVRTLLITALYLVIALILYSSLYHAYRCHNDLRSSLLFGLMVCEDCKPKTDTLLIERISGQKIEAPINTASLKKQLPEKKEGSTFIFRDKVTGQAQQFGDNNTQNNVFADGRPRTVGEESFPSFFKDVPDKNKRIIFNFMQPPDKEMLDLKFQIETLLKKHGYNNIDPTERSNNVQPVPEPNIFYKYDDTMAVFIISPNH